ncbi:MAG: hypothetical protein ACRCS8_00360 [Brevinema sp.]
MKGNGGSFDSKKEGVSGKDIELKFLLEARKQSFKIDSNIKEYRFTDEDKLAFSIDEREFFDLFDRQDRGLGEYLKYVLEERGSRNLMNKLWLNHKVNRSCTHRDLMDKVQRSCSKKVVSLGEISEKILKEMGQNSPSNSQISDLSKKFADENRLNGDPVKLLLFKDQTARLSTKVVGDLYRKNSLSTEDQRNLEQGFYILKQSDIDFVKSSGSNGTFAFWERILPDYTERNNTLQARTKAGYTNDISTLRAGKKLFVADKKAVKKVESAHGDSLKKLVELAKICEISLPSDFATKVSSTILQQTHNKNNTDEFLKGLSWETIKELKLLPLKHLAELKKYIKEVVKECL